MSARIFLCAAVVWVASSIASLAAPLPVTTVKLSETKARYEASYSYPRTGKAAIQGRSKKLSVSRGPKRAVHAITMVIKTKKAIMRRGMSRRTRSSSTPSTF
jgi:hypothetical protein